MRTRICDECKANPAQFALRNGEKISYLCEPSFKEVLLGLVTSNDTVIFAEVGDMKARSMVSNAILWKRLDPQRANPPGHGPLVLSASAWLPLPERDFSEPEESGAGAAASELAEFKLPRRFLHAQSGTAQSSQRSTSTR
jgi:hypothetical protein